MRGCTCPHSGLNSTPARAPHAWPSLLAHPDRRPLSGPGLYSPLQCPESLRSRQLPHWRPYPRAPMCGKRLSWRSEARSPEAAVCSGSACAGRRRRTCHPRWASWPQRTHTTGSGEAHLHARSLRGVGATKVEPPQHRMSAEYPFSASARLTRERTQSPSPESRAAPRVLDGGSTICRRLTIRHRPRHWRSRSAVLSAAQLPHPQACFIRLSHRW
jgi:hypothetical protein